MNTVNALIRFFLFPSVLLSLGCGLVPERSNMPPAHMVRDVSYQAREGGEEGLRQRVLVLPFLSEKTGRSQVALEAARNTVVRELGRTGQFLIIDNADFPHTPSSFLNEQGEYKLEEISRIAAGMGVAAIIEGKILEVKARRIGDEVGLFRSIKANVETTVRLRVFAARNSKEILSDVRTASVQSSTTRVGESTYSDRHLEDDPKLLRAAVLKAFYGSVGQIVRAVEKLSWEGRVALISGEKVYVNAGRLSGLQVGDILKITEEGEEVFDPETGVFIGRAPGRMKGTVEVVSYFGKDGAVAIVHSGSGFSQNDRVQLY